MAKDPAFLFYPGDYLRDTQMLSEKTQVAYDRIMCEHMRNICITQQQLKFLTKKLSEDELIELMMTLTKVNGGYQIEWVTESICKRKAYSDSRRNNRKGKNKKDMLTYDKHMEDEIEIENIDDNKNEFNEKDKKFYSFLCEKFDVNEITNYDKVRKISTAITFMKNQPLERDRYFRDNCFTYFKYKDKSGEKIHNLDSFLGDPQDKYEGGGWNKANWKNKMKEIAEEEPQTDIKKTLKNQSEQSLINTIAAKRKWEEEKRKKK